MLWATATTGFADCTACCDIDPEKRYICQFPQDNTIISVNSAYGGNVLLGKKCFALRIASYQGWKEGWMAEHMLILGLENPKGESQVYLLRHSRPPAARPTSPCLFRPRDLQKQGLQDLDASATISPGSEWVADGRLYAINPENGFFGVAPGTNEKSNPNALAATKKEYHFHKRCA